MSEYEKKYDAFEIFEEIKAEEEKQPRFQSEKLIPSETSDANDAVLSLNDGMYYEIEYDASPMPGVGKFVLRSQRTEPLKTGETEGETWDEVRDIFNQMRDIARENRSLFYSSSKFYDKRVQQEKSEIFYKQAEFMKDFEDEYSRIVPYSSYFPCYQMMGYEQLRTYFTWRTQVRRGHVADGSLSYAFLYIYELLNNTGVDDPQDGLDRLMSFWEEFRAYDKSIDRYVLKWLKDYHIYYELPWSFREFVDKNGLARHYPQAADCGDSFDLFCTISKYDIRKSGFYAGDRIKLIRDCFYHVIGRVKDAFTEKGLDYEEIIFQPTKNMSVWVPFKEALFYPWMNQRDRRVVISPKEIYLCRQNKWTHNAVLTTECGRQVAGYMLKQMEAVLRKAVKYRYKLSASIDIIHPVMVRGLQEAGISLEQIVTDAVMEFYREETKTVVRVDAVMLDKIRQEALLTQEKLIVPEEEEMLSAVPGREEDMPDTPGKEETVAAAPARRNDSVSVWDELKAAFNETERNALCMILDGDGGIKRYADEHGMMLEVLLDGINEKAMDIVGDSLLDDEFTIYEDYVEYVRGMVE